MLSMRIKNSCGEPESDYITFHSRVHAFNKSSPDHNDKGYIYGIRKTCIDIHSLSVRATSTRSSTSEVETGEGKS
jgi:hypothetical protein